MGSGVYGKRRHQRDAKITAEDSRRDQIIVQLSAGNDSFFVPKLNVPVTLERAVLLGSVGAATTTTTGYLSIDVLSINASRATTATLCATIQASGTVANGIVEASAALTEALGADECLMVKTGATTLFDDNAAVAIHYIKDES